MVSAAPRHAFPNSFTFSQWEIEEKQTASAVDTFVISFAARFEMKPSETAKG
jgi:hypothetical protein